MHLAVLLKQAHAVLVKLSHRRHKLYYESKRPRNASVRQKVQKL